MHIGASQVVASSAPHRQGGDGGGSTQAVNVTHTCELMVPVINPVRLGPPSACGVWRKRCI
eukprot:386276-Amphidinium_carterae.1